MEKMVFYQNILKDIKVWTVYFPNSNLEINTVGRNIKLSVSITKKAIIEKS